uniref:Uncharacterized protein n=1 Tax=Anguilla anguilla TaxID=7936 RepID=A0A0E9XYK8_ANGAN
MYCQSFWCHTPNIGECQNLHEHCVTGFQEEYPSYERLVNEAHCNLIFMMLHLKELKRTS